MTTEYTLPPLHSLVLRACHSTMESSRGFYYPLSGEVSAPDWEATAECGHGLHGWLWGEGLVRESGAEWAFSEENVKWLVLQVLTSSLIDLNGKVKFPSATVVFVGDRKEATDFIQKYAPSSVRAIIGAFVTTGERGTSTSGDGGTSTSGEKGTLCIKRYDRSSQRYRMETAYVGESGILPNTPYKLDENGKFVAVKV